MVSHAVMYFWCILQFAVLSLGSTFKLQEGEDRFTSALQHATPLKRIPSVDPV